MSLEDTLHQLITFLEKKKGINNRKETMPIDRHIHSSKVVVNPHPLLMAHGLCMLCIEDRHGNKVFAYWKAWETNINSYSSWSTYGYAERNGRAIRYLLGGRHGKQAIT